MSTFTPNDPLWTSQWYLNNTGQRGGAARLDLKLLAAWSQGFNGQGVRVAINDDGFDLTHPDLVANIDASKVYDTNRDQTGKGFVTTKADAHEHGTVVGSIVGMAANGMGGIGIAYKATLIPGIAVGILDDSPANAKARLFAANLAAGADVSVNSWGKDEAFQENFGASGDAEDRAWGEQLLKAATEGRAGLGMVIEVSAGNERENRADAGLSNFTNNKVTIAVGAVDETGKATDYSTPGACLLVTAFGGVASAAQSENRGFGIVSADMQGTAGYNKTSGAEGDYAYQSQGTSYSGPMVGAAAALMLQANPKLGFRDVSAILAMTARQTDPTSASWVTNGATHWNLGGMHFSRDYGYGLIDISAAVMLAQSWVPTAATMANWIKAESGPRTAVVQAIPDDSTRSLSITAQVGEVIRIDRVEFDLNLTATSPSQLRAEVTSPSGTTITLFDRPLTRELKDSVIVPDSKETAWPASFTIGSTAFLGESSAGNWTLKLTDLVSGVEAVFNSFTVRAWGAAVSADDQYVLTDEYKGNKTLTDALGTDTINAAALSTAVQLDLRGSAVSKVGIAGGTISWATGTVIESAVGGMGADTLIGNEVGNLLRGNGGSDSVEGGAGDDSLEGGIGNDRLDGGEGSDTAIYQGSLGDYKVTSIGGVITVTDGNAARDGTDTVERVEALRFADYEINTGVKTVSQSVSKATLDRVIELYVAFFNRIPDANGLSYWLTQAKAGTPISTIADTFYGAGVQYSSLTGFSAAMTNADFVNVIYRNVLGRKDGADAEGLAYWTGELSSGRASRGTLVNTILDSAHTFKGNATFGYVADLLDNKIAVAKQIAVDWGLNYLTADASITNGMAIAKAVTATDTSVAVALVGITPGSINLGG